MLAITVPSFAGDKTSHHFLPHNNLLSFFKLNGDALDSTAQNDGYFINGPLMTATGHDGKPNTALNFNGTAQYIATSNSYVGPNTLTMSIWFKTTTNQGGALIGFSSNATGNGGSRDRFIYMTNDGRLVFGAAPGRNKRTITTSGKYNDGNWYLATATLGAGGMRLYVNGEQVGSNSATSGESYSGYWRIGHNDLSTWPDAPATFFFQGTLDDAAIYTRELAVDEVKALYAPLSVTAVPTFTCPGASVGKISVTASGGTAPYQYKLNDAGFVSSNTFANVGIGEYDITVKDKNGKLGYATAIISSMLSTIPRSNLIAQYAFNGNVKDETGNNPATAHGSPTFTQNRFATPSSAISLNGSNQYVSTSNKYNDPNDFSWSMWFQTGTKRGGVLAGFGRTFIYNQYNSDRLLYMNNAGQLYFGVYPDRVVTVNTTKAYNDNQWHHVVATLSSKNGMKLYVDGELIGYNSGTKNGQAYEGTWTIGYGRLKGWTSNPSSEYFTGNIDFANLYGRAITQEEVTELYTRSTGASSNGPVCAGSTLQLTASSYSGATYSWSGPGGFTSNLQNPTRDFTTGMVGTYTVSVSLNGCTLNASTIVTATNNPGQWTGNKNANWSEADNWCDGVVPAATTNVTIPAGARNMPVVSGVAKAQNITIAAGAALSTAAGGNLEVSGFLSNQGTMNNSGTVTFNGTSAQTFAGVASFENMVIANAAGVSLPENIAVNNLTIQTGTLKAETFDIDVKGNWTNNSGTPAFNGGTGKVTFTGTKPQTIAGNSPTTFYTMYASSVGSEITLQQNTIIQNTLVVGGVFDIQSYSANGLGAGTIYMSTKGVLKIGGDKTYPTGYATYTFLPASTVEYYGAAQTIKGYNYGNLVLSSGGGAVSKISENWNTQGDFIIRKGAGTSVATTALANHSIGGSVSIESGATLNGASSVIEVNGNWKNEGTFTGNSSTVKLMGTATNVSGSGADNFHHLRIEGAGVNFANELISLTGNLSTGPAGSFLQDENGTVKMTGSTATISGNNITVGNLRVSGSGKVTVVNHLNVAGNLQVDATSNTLTVNGGVATMWGASKTISGSGSYQFKNLNIKGSVSAAANFAVSELLNVEGALTATAGTATFTGSSALSGEANLYNVSINGTKLVLSANAVLGVAGAFDLQAGVLDAAASTPNLVHFNGNGAQSIPGVSYHHLKMTNGNKTAAAGIIIKGDIDISAATTFTGGNYTHEIYQHWKNAGTFVPGSGTVSFKGPNNTTITGATTFYNLKVQHAVKTVALVLYDNISTTVANVETGNIQTGDNTITITEHRTGNGIIMGNIVRTHAFSTGVDYAFEGPDNLIRFSVVSGVSSVRISVFKKEVEDFPNGNAIGRLYDIEVDGGSYTGTLRLHYEDNELNGANEDQLDLWKTASDNWMVVGKTGNDITRNFVETDNISSVSLPLSGRWTFSAVPSKFVWRGGVSSAWHNGKNWLDNGSLESERVPGPSDIVEIGVETFTNQPVITTPAFAQNIVMGSQKAVNLKINAGGALSTSTIKGSWNKNATHTITLAPSTTANLTGDLILSTGTANRRINLAIGAGIVTVAGNLVQSGDATLTMGSGKLNIGGDYIKTGSGNFTKGTGTVIYNGLENQVVAPVIYQNLEISKSGGQAFISGATTVDKNLLVKGELQTEAEVMVKGNVTIDAGGKVVNKNIIHVGGNWVNSGEFEGLGLKVVFDGSGLQKIYQTTFNHLEINKTTGVVELAGDVTLKGNLWGTSGTLDIKNFEFNRDIFGGAAVLEANATLILGGTTAPRNFSNYNLDPASTIILNGTGPQALLLSGIEYGNLIFRNAGLKTIEASITVKGNLMIENGATVAAAANNIFLLGNWTNMGSFEPATSNVFWNGTGTISGVTTFNKVVVSGTYNVLNSLTFNDLLEINPAAVVTSLEGVNYTMHSDFTNSGSLTILGEGIFTGNQKQTLRLMNAVETSVRTITFNGSVSPDLISSSAPSFGIININNTGGVTTSVGWTILSQLNVGAGAKFNMKGYTQNLFGSMVNRGEITTTGVFNIAPPGAATIDFGTAFSSTGTVVFGNSGAITINGSPKALNNITIENSNAAGITPSSGWNLSGDLVIERGSLLKAASHTHKIKGHIRDSGKILGQTSTFVLNGTIIQSLESTSVFHNVTIDKKDGYVELLTDLQVAGVLRFEQGTISTGGHNVAMREGSGVVNASATTGWVNGYLNKFIPDSATNSTFEIGDENAYTPVEIDFSPSASEGYLTAKSNRGEHPHIRNSVINAENSVNRYFSFRNEGVTVDSFNVTFNFLTTDLDEGAVTTNFGVARYNGSSWSIARTIEAGGLRTIARSPSLNIDFAIGEICNAGTSIAYSAPILCTDEEETPVIAEGTLGGHFSSAPGLAIDPETGNIDLRNSTPGTYTVEYVIAKEGSCASFITNTEIKIGVRGEWSGDVGPDWNSDENWSCKVPEITDDVTIPAGREYYPVITEENGVHHLHISAGASLIVEGLLTVSGDINNAGQLDMTRGALQMSGESEQTIPALKNSALKTLLINNSSSSGVVLGHALELFGGLEFMGRGMKLNTGDQLTLKSTKEGTAWVGDVTGNEITGEVAVERHLSDYKAWRVLSIPTNTTQTIKQSWMEGGMHNDDPHPGYGLQITSERSTWQQDGFDLYSRGGASMKKYDPVKDVWVGVTSAYNPINTDRGYMVFMRGNRKSNAFNSPVTETVLRTKGPLKMGDQPKISTLPGTYTLVGNPYASAIDLEKLRKGEGVSSSFSVWDPYISGNYNLGGYQTISATTGYIPTPGGTITYPTGKPAKLIPSGHAFFVYSNADDGSGKNFEVQFQESAKETSRSSGGGSIARGALRRGGTNKRSFIWATLFTGPQSNARVADGNVVAFDTGFSNKVDGDDAKKIIAGGENFAIKRNGDLLAVEARAQVTQSDTIHYYMTNLVRGIYQLRFAPVNMESQDVQAYLIDNYLQSTTTVSLLDSTFIDITITSDAGSSANDRFKLVFRPMAPLPVTVTSLKADAANDAVAVAWKTHNEANIGNYEVERSDDGGTFEKVHAVAALNQSSAQYRFIDKGLSAGTVYYRVKISGIDGRVTYTDVVKVVLEGKGNRFSVYPNPLENDRIDLYINAPEAKIRLRLMNDLGQQVLIKEIDHVGGSGKVVIPMQKKMSRGVYQLEITGAGKKEMIKVRY